MFLFYSINDCPVENIEWLFVWFNFQLFSEGKLYSSTSLIYFYCITYRNIVSRRQIRVHPGSRRGFFFWSSGQRWINWSPELWFGRTKDHELSRLQYRQAPVHNPIILCNFLLFVCAFKLLELNENLRCIILGTYWSNTRNRVRLDAMLIGPVKVEWLPVTREIYKCWLFTSCNHYKDHGQIWSTASL